MFRETLEQNIHFVRREKIISICTQSINSHIQQLHLTFLGALEKQEIKYSFVLVNDILEIGPTFIRAWISL